MRTTFSFEMKSFQNISCYCLSSSKSSMNYMPQNFKTSHVIVYLFYPGYRHLISGISKHLMLLFIFSPSALSTGNTLFQNISCYCLSLAFPRFLVSPLPFFPLYFLYFSIFYQPTPLS